MILGVCPNLAIDVTLEVPRLEIGAVHRARSVRRQAGGKGVNLARALRSLGALGDDCLVLGFAGGRTGEAIAEGLEGEDVSRELVSFPGENRSCTIVITLDGSATVVNEPGPRIEDGSGLLSRFDALLPRASAVALMGSLPPGLDPSIYAEMIRRARAREIFTLLDTAGEALRLGLAAGPSVAKPNRVEAEELLRCELETEAARFEALGRIRALGAGIAILTLGAEGFVFASEGVAARCTSRAPSDPRLGNPTGAGDALAAGWLAGTVRGYPLEDCARLGSAAALASLAEGYGRFRSRDVSVESATVSYYS